MTKKTMKSAVITMLAVLVFLYAVIPMTLQAKTKDKGISKTKMITYTNMSETLKVANPTAKVKWKSSNRNIATVLGSTGRKNEIATIVSGNKTGTCTITAFVEKKSYKCRVTVKKDKKISRAALVSVEQTKNEIVVVARINNKSQGTLRCGQDYWLEKFSKGKWKKVPINKDNISEFESVAYLLKPNSRVTRTCRISKDVKDDMYLRSQITKGTYRMYVNAEFAKKVYNYVVFRIE